MEDLINMVSTVVVTEFMKTYPVIWLCHVTIQHPNIQSLILIISIP